MVVTVRLVTVTGKTVTLVTVTGKNVTVVTVKVAVTVACAMSQLLKLLL